MTSSRPKSPTDSLIGQFKNLNVSPASTNKMSSVAGDRPKTPGNHDSEEGKDDFKVDHFYGDRVKMRQYLAQLKTIFELRPKKYHKDHSKVLFASAHLRGSAFHWFEPYLTDYLDHTRDSQEGDTVAIFADFDKFQEQLKQVFGTVDEERSAARQIMQLT